MLPCRGSPGLPQHTESGRLGKKTNTHAKVMCAGRESNSGLVRGRDVYYHCTTGADSTVARDTVDPATPSATPNAAGSGLAGCTHGFKIGSYGAMAARWIPDPKVGGSNPSSFMPFFLPVCNAPKKNAAETGNRTQAAAATTRSPATRLFRRSAAYGGSGYRSRFSTLRRLYATMYNNPP